MATFADALSTLSDTELRTLIAHRPDAFFPTPPSVGALATRLGLAGSVAHALRSLNAADLHALEQLGAMGAELDAVDASAINLVRTSNSEEANPVQRLRERALAYGPNTGLRVAPGALSGLPAGWRVSDTAPPRCSGAYPISLCAGASRIGDPRRFWRGRHDNATPVRCCGQGGVRLTC